MKNIIKFLSVAVLCIGILAPLQAGAALYVSEGTGNGLAKVNKATGTGASVAAYNPAAQILCQAFTPNGVMWAYDYASGQFFTVNPSTAAVTAVGVANPANAPCVSLASSPGGQLFMTLEFDNRLFRVNKADGSTTLVGVITDSNGAPMPAGYTVYGLAFDSAGVLHALYTDGAGLWAIFTLNPATAIAPIGSFVPVTGIPGPFLNMTIDPATNKMYVVNHNGIELYSVNKQTGVGTLIGNTGLAAAIFGITSTWPVPASGGGCALNDEGGFDPMLPLLTLLALGVLYRRRSSI